MGINTADIVGEDIADLLFLLSKSAAPHFSSTPSARRRCWFGGVMPLDTRRISLNNSVVCFRNRKLVVARGWYREGRDRGVSESTVYVGWVECVVEREELRL